MNKVLKHKVERCFPGSFCENPRAHLDWSMKGPLTYSNHGPIFPTPGRWANGGWEVCCKRLPRKKFWLIHLKKRKREKHHQAGIRWEKRGVHQRTGELQLFLVVSWPRHWGFPWEKLDQNKTSGAFPHTWPSEDEKNLSKRIVIPTFLEILTRRTRFQVLKTVEVILWFLGSFSSAKLFLKA